MTDELITPRATCPQCDAAVMAAHTLPGPVAGLPHQRRFVRRRAVGYCRVATAPGDGAPAKLARQQSVVADWLDARGYDVAGWQLEHGPVGPGLQRALVDAADRGAEVLAVHSVDRLGRDMAKVAAVLDRLAELGLQLVGPGVPEGLGLTHLAVVVASSTRWPPADRTDCQETTGSG